jgi:hypothetical protein
LRLIVISAATEKFSSFLRSLVDGFRFAADVRRVAVPTLGNIRSQLLFVEGGTP